MIRLRGSIVALFALGSALILGSVAVTRANAETQRQTQPKVQARAPATPTAGLASPLAAQPLDHLSATRERPLFSASRRLPPPPPAPTIGPPPPPPPPPNVTLVGIVMDAEEAHAIVRSGSQNEMRRVRIGDDIGGWKVSQIEGRKLVLSLDSRLATFTMFGGHGSPAPKAADKQLQPSSSPSSPGTPINLGRRRGHDD
jgi:hypothetical protein